MNSLGIKVFASETRQGLDEFFEYYDKNIYANNFGDVVINFIYY